MKLKKYLKWLPSAAIVIIPTLFGAISLAMTNDTNYRWMAGIGTVLFVIAAVVDIRGKVKLEKNIDLPKEIEEYNKILNKSFDIFNEKKRVIINEMSEHKYADDIIKYNVHEHMRFITTQLKDCICDITGIDPKNLSVHLMYKHTKNEKANKQIKCEGANKHSDDKDKIEDWKWIDGNNISVSHTLRKLISDENSCYYRVLHTNDKFIFENDKLEAIAKEEYVSSDRDKYYGKIGSIMCSKIDCGRYGESYIEAVLSISSYGRRFVGDNDKDKVAELTDTMKYKVLPYYNALLEIELVSLSLRHSIKEGNLKRKRVIPCKLRLNNRKM